MLTKTNLSKLTTPSNEACATGVSEIITDIDMHEIIQNGSTPRTNMMWQRILEIVQVLWTA